MKISVQPMILRGDPQIPEHFEMSLDQFFIRNALYFQDPARFPLCCDGKEGGCQFAFDRDENAPMRCITCNSSPCCCGEKVTNKPRYALQRFTETRICILDIDVNSLSGRRKYETLLPDEEQELQKMQTALMGLPQICFFYRTKCNGFRVAFENASPMRDLAAYQQRHDLGVELVKRCTPDGQLGGSSWFCFDSVARDGQAYWSYPRAQNPFWLNPDCSDQ